jgi:hypothetical protein
MRIIPGLGAGKISFGITEAEAVALLGKADNVYTTDGGCKRLQFYPLRVELSFEPESENRLGWIEVYNPGASLGDRKLIGKSQPEVLEFVSDFLKEQPEQEDYGAFLSVSYPDHWVELQFQFGTLECINIGVLYDQSEKPVWPIS